MGLANGEIKLTMLAVASVELRACACVSTRTCLRTHGRCMAATVAIMAWVELFTNAAITNIPTITSAVADARAYHLAACIKSATMTANFTVVNWLTFSSTAGPPRLTNTAMHSRARHFTRCFLMAFANTNVATIGKITVVDGKAEGA